MSPRDNNNNNSSQPVSGENSVATTPVVSRSNSKISDDVSMDQPRQQQQQQEQEQQSLQATAEMCHYCFDVLIKELYSNNNNSSNSNNQLSSSTNSNNRSWRSPFTIGGNGGGSGAGTTSGTCNSTGSDKTYDENITSISSSSPSPYDEILSSVSTFVKYMSPSISAPLFVTWDKINNNSRFNISGRSSHSSSSSSVAAYYELRGCIGTLSERNLQSGIGEYALTSALRDKRFNPICKSEINELRVTVSLLVKYEVCSSVYDWTVGVHGIIIKFVDPKCSTMFYSATYLPEVSKEQGWSVQEAVISLIRKSGFNGQITAAAAANSDNSSNSNSNNKNYLNLNDIHCTRYQSSKYRLTFDEYVKRIGYDPIMHLDKQQKEEMMTASNNKRKNRFVFF